MLHVEVYRKKNSYLSFPSVVALKEGQLAVTFREAGAASAKAALSGSHTHQDLDSRIMLTRSRDFGRTWEAPSCIFEGRYAVGDPAISVLRDGRWMVRFGRWSLVPRDMRQSLSGRVMRHYAQIGMLGCMEGNGFSISDDQGQSWRPLESTVQDPFLSRAMSREPVVELADGTLLLTVYEGYPLHSERAWLIRSWNGGSTWGDPSLIAGHYPEERSYRYHANYNEAALLPMDAGNTLLAVIRVDQSFEADNAGFISEGGVGELHWAISRDAGFTWSNPQPTGLWGQPAHLLKVKDNDFICTYGYRRSPYGVRAARFKLEGGEFRVIGHLILRDDAAGWDCGYPSTAILSDGSFFSTYYHHGEDQVRVIAGTTWCLSDFQES